MDGVAAEGFADWGSSDEKATQDASLTQESVVFALRGFACFRAELGVGA